MIKATKKLVYLDNAATTRPADEVIKVMARCMRELYANPSSSHAPGVEAANYIDECRKKTRQLICNENWDVIFTSTGTEANNLAITGYTSRAPKTKCAIVTTSIEHSSILEPLNRSHQRGYEIIKVKPDSNGTISINNVVSCVNEKTLLITIQHGNNEIGTLQPVEKIAEKVKKISPDVLIHVDAIQTAGKIRLQELSNHVDLISISAHKFHGPKGVGALLVKKGRPLPSPMITGGGQQKDLRSGTEDLPSIAGMTTALEESYKNLEDKIDYIMELEKTFIENFTPESNSKLGFINAPRIPGHITVLFRNIPPEVVQNAMEDKGVIISSSAACSSRKIKRSPVLEASGLSKDVNMVRIVVSRFNERWELAEAAKILSQVLKKLMQ